MSNDLWKLPPEKLHGTIIEIPVYGNRLRTDPNQPRTEIDPEELATLVESIRERGALVPITADFGGTDRDGNFFYIRSGHRRFLAHQNLGKETVRCLISAESYIGEKGIGRMLNQAVENVIRAPHSHAELTRLYLAMYEEEKALRNGAKGGAKAAAEKFARAFGKSIDWAEQYQQLGRLEDDLVDDMDKIQGGKRVLDLKLAMKVSAAPPELQQSLLEESKNVLAKAGQMAQRDFVSRKTREVRYNSGAGVRSRGFNPQENLMSILNDFNKTARRLYGSRSQLEFEEYLQKIASILRNHERHEVLSRVRFALSGLETILRVMETHSEMTPPKSSAPDVEKSQENHLPRTTAAKPSAVDEAPTAQMEKSESEVKEPEGLRPRYGLKSEGVETKGQTAPKRRIVRGNQY